MIRLLAGAVVWPCGLVAEGTTHSHLAQSSPADFLRETLDHGVGKLSALRREGKGVPLVLIPGTFSDASQWTETIESLPEDLPLVLIELRGQGESWPPKPDNSVEELAQDTLWVLSKMEIDKFHIGGHSLGGMVALEMGRVAPTRVRSVISIEGWTHHSVEREAFGDLLRNTLSEVQLQERAERRAQVEAKWGKERMVEFAQVWKRWDGSGFLNTTHLPVLEIWGDRGLDQRPSLEQLRIPKRANIRVAWIEDASHNLPTEKPQEVGKLISGFLGE